MNTAASVVSDPTSLKIRDVPTHQKGYKNEWGALLEHQAEIQRQLEDEVSLVQEGKKHQWKQELDNQLMYQNKQQRLQEVQNRNIEERRVLEENHKRFQRKEKMREVEEKERTRDVVGFNSAAIQAK